MKILSLQTTIAVFCSGATLPLYAFEADPDFACLFRDRIGSVLEGTTYEAITSDNDLLWALAADNTLEAWDISLPNPPAWLGEVPNAVNGLSSPRLVVDGNYAYLFKSFGNLQIFDITDPSSPELVGEEPSTLFVSDLAVQDGVAVVSQGSDTLVIDATSPSSPTVATRIQHGLNVFPESYAFHGSELCVLAFAPDGLWLHRFTIKSPSDLVPLKPRLLAPGAAETNADIFIWDSIAAIGHSGYGVSTYDIADPEDLTFLGFAELSIVDDIGRIGDMLYVDQDSEGIAIIDVLDPSEPTVVGRYDTVFDVAGVAQVSHTLLLNGGDGLDLVDVSQPTNPLLGRAETTDSLHVSMNDELAVVADSFGGVRFIDVRDPTDPTLLLADAGSGRRADIDHGLAFVAEGHLGMSIWDISDPDSISFAGRYSRPNQLFGHIEVAHPNAFLTCALTDVIEVLDVSDPANVFSVASFPTPDVPVSLIEYDDVLYTSFRDGGSWVFASLSIADPVNPVLLDTLPIGNFATNSSINFPYCYLACEDAGVVIVNISEPSAMSIAGELALGAKVLDVHIEGLTAIAAVEDEGLFVLDVTNPMHPTVLGTLGGANATGISKRGNLVAYTTGDTLELIDTGCVLCSADITGDGILNFFDITAYINLFNKGDESADLAEPFGTLNFFDISEFIGVYNSGCP